MRRPAILQALLLSLAVSWPAFAQDDPDEVGTVPINTGEDEAAGEDLPSATYSTIGLSKVSADFDNVNDAINLESTLIGIRIPTFPWVGVELNAAFTMIPGQVDQPSNCGGITQPACPTNISTSNESFVAHVFGVYLAGRSPGKYFAMGKLGYNFLNSSLPEFRDEGNGTSWTAGGGYRWARDGFVELGYTRITDKIDAIGITISYSHDR